MSIFQSTVYIILRAGDVLGDRVVSSQEELNKIVQDTLFNQPCHYRVARKKDGLSLPKSVSTEESQAYAQPSSEDDDRKSLSDVMGAGAEATMHVSFADDPKEEMELTVVRDKKSRLLSVHFTDTDVLGKDVIILASRDFVSVVGSRLLHTQQFTDFLRAHDAIVFIDHDAVPDGGQHYSEISLIGSCGIVVRDTLLSQEDRQQALAKDINDAFFTAAIVSVREAVQKEYDLQRVRLNAAYAFADLHG